MYSISFFCAWVNREANTFADKMSKIEDSDNWQIDDELYSKIVILSKYKFTVDLFASDENCKVKRFYSRFECPNTRGVDCFNFSWKNEVVYACPPPPLCNENYPLYERM